jgi:hypothetical protein
MTVLGGWYWTVSCKCKKIVEITYTAVYSSLVVWLYRFIHGSLFAVHVPGNFLWGEVNPCFLYQIVSVLPIYAVQATVDSYVIHWYRDTSRDAYCSTGTHDDYKLNWNSAKHYTGCEIVRLHMEMPLRYKHDKTDELRAQGNMFPKKKAITSTLYQIVKE